jgi:hypothetical protein
MEELLKEAEALSLPCFDLIPAEEGDQIVAHWGGQRSDLPEKLPPFVKAFKSQRHFLSVEQELFDKIALQGRGPLALAMVTTDEDDEVLHHVTVSSGKLSEIIFENSIPLAARFTKSMPPLEALLLYGGQKVGDWLASQNLQRWEYSDVDADVRDGYMKHFNAQLPLCVEQPPYARIGGWHVTWPDDDFYLPREMRLMLWTFQNAEPWYEVFLSPLRNYVIKSRIT